MATIHVDSIDRTVQKTKRWLAELETHLGTDDAEAAWRINRAYMHVLRDRLTIQEAAQLAAQLTHLLRGVYYEGFDPDRAPEKYRDRDEFLARVARLAQLDDPAEAEDAVRAVTRVMRDHISAGELDDVLSQLPGEIRSLLALA
jgi:uncharacterized protein (DUF2267 family)